MVRRDVAVPIVGAFLLAGVLSGQAPAPVDFRRDVQPLIQQHCIACHGPEQQMNAFRLDRRSAALRGGTRTVIVPGNSAASRLYLRLIGNEFGRKMPATGSLTPEEIAIVRAWIDQGAKWPDDLANEPNLTPPDPTALKMAEAIRNGATGTFLKLVGGDRTSLNRRGPGGSTPFMSAVLYSDAAMVGRLLEQGADPNARNDANATALMWAVGDLAKTRLLVEHGAEVNARSSDARTPLLIAATRAGNAPVVKYLLEHGAKPDSSTGASDDASPLRAAAAAGDAETMHLLIAHGASIKRAGAGAISGSIEAGCMACFDLVANSLDARAYSTALLALAVFGRARDVRLMLDHGADVNVRDEAGRTPLMFAANCDCVPVDTVQLLIDRGADVNARNGAGLTALDSARLHGNTPVVDRLIAAGATGEQAAAPAVKYARDNTVQQAVQKAVPLIQRADLGFTQKSGCISCHNEALTDLAMSAARNHGFRVDEEMATLQVKRVAAFLDDWRERLLQGAAPGGVAYTLVGLHGVRYTPDVITDAVARYIRMKQFPDGHWSVGCGGSRNPLCGGEITNTANSMRALQLYAPPADKADYRKAIRLAGEWLAGAAVATNEDRTFRVFGLAWAHKNKASIQNAVRDLLSTQHADGGWSDIATTGSTAYATGEAMAALHEAGVPLTDPAFQRGVTFLLRTQVDDGSWHVETHSFGVQPYFDAGFPHGVDQWISASATSWAIVALAPLSQTTRTSQ